MGRNRGEGRQPSTRWKMFRFWRKNDCRKVQGRLSEYIDGYLAPEERLRVERHLKVCPMCRSELDSLRGTVELLRAVPSVAPPRSFALARTPVPATPAPRLFRPALLGAATSVLALLLVLVMAGDLLHLFEPGRASLTNQTPTPTLSRDVVPMATGGETGVGPPTDAGAEKVSSPPSLASTPTPAPTGEATLGASPLAQGGTPVAAGPPGAVRWIEIGLALMVVILAALTLFARQRVRRVGSGGS